MTAAGCDGRLVAWLKSGDSRAWASLDSTYRPSLLRLIHGRVPKGLRSKIDEEDILQEVFCSIFVRVRQGTFHCDTDERLYQILCIRARKRLRGEIRRHQRRRRDYRREEGTSSTATMGRFGIERLTSRHWCKCRFTELGAKIFSAHDRFTLSACCRTRTGHHQPGGDGWPGDHSNYSPDRLCGRSKTAVCRRRNRGRM